MKKDLIYLIIILLLLFGGWLGYQYHLRKLSEKDDLYKVEILKNNKLEKINETQYRKLVADTATIKELRNIIDDLGIKLAAKPKIIETIKLVPIEIEKPVDDVIIKGDSIQITDYYPQKENYFVSYSNSVDILSKKGKGLWNFRPVDISIALSQREDGIWQSNIKVPDYILVNDLDIVATPMEPPKIDNFGWILGVGYGKYLGNSVEDYIRISGGLRYKKIYLDIGANTNKQIDGNIKFEF